MINPFKDVDWNPDFHDRRRFSYSLLIGFPCTALAYLAVGRLTTGTLHFQLAAVLGGIGAAAGLLFLATPVLAKPFYIVWYFLACCVGLVVGNLVLTIMFYTAVTGIGLMMRLIGRAPIRKRQSNNPTTHWHNAGSPVDPGRYYRQF